jgi:hypothetical protein
MDSALGALPSERAGSGSGLLMTLRQTGGAIGVAILGSVIAGSYSDRLDTTGLPAAAAHAASGSVGAAHAVAEALGSPALAASANTAYVHGMDLALLACGVASLLAAVLVAVFLPNPRGTAEPAGAADVAAQAVDA